jgi:toxin-antitoxin system PIN domain toxin
LTILDANILLYAYNADAPENPAARSWIESLFSTADWVGLPWLTLWAFLRVSTNARLYPRPLTGEEAFQILGVLLEHPKVRITEPGPRHAEILKRLVMENQAGGRLLSDAALAALAVEHGATLASTDRDFSRFAELRWVNPLG